MHKPAALPFIALLLGCAALALGPWLVRLAEVGPVTAAFWRVALAVPMLALIAGGLKLPLRAPSRRALLVIVVAAFFFAADLGVWHVGILLTKMANAVLFGNAGSFLFALYGLWIARQRPSLLQVAALGLAVLGTLMLLSGSLELGPTYLRGDMLTLIAGLLYGGYLIGIDKVRRRVEPLTVILWASIAAAVFLLPAAMALEGQLVPSDWSIMFLLALSSQVVGQGLLVYAIGRLSPLVVGIALLAQPAIAGTVGWIFYDEVFTFTDWAGAIAIGIALVLVRLRPPSRTPIMEQ